MIQIRISAVDGFSRRYQYKTLAKAQERAQHYVGECPDLGGWYAVSSDGICKVEVERGCALIDLFPKLKPEPVIAPKGVWINGEWWPDESEYDDPVPYLRGPAFLDWMCRLSGFPVPDEECPF